MKGRLNSTILMLVVVNFVALFAVLTLAFGAGAHSEGLSLLDVGALKPAAGFRLLAATGVAIIAGLFVWFRMSNKVAAPVSQLVEYAEKFSSGDYKARLDADADDDFGYIAT